jgi:hypothetical protein
VGIGLGFGRRKGWISFESSAAMPPPSGYLVPGRGMHLPLDYSGAG